jgi:hypothetical protein
MGRVGAAKRPEEDLAMLIRPTKTDTFSRFRPAALAFALALLAAACTQRTTADTEADAGTRECDAYLEAYRGCMGRLSPDTPQIADARTAAARDSLARLTDPEKKRQACVNGAAQLRASCQ